MPIDCGTGDSGEQGFRTMRLTSQALDDEEAVLDDLAQAGVNVPSLSRASSKPPSRSSTSAASAR